MKYVWLSYPLAIDGPRPPAIPSPSLEEYLFIEKDGASVQKLQIYSHTGTHLDTAAHVIQGGVSITEFSPEDLVFVKPVVIELRLGLSEIVTAEMLCPLEESIKGADMLIVRFGYSDIRKSCPESFSKECAGFGIEAAEWLREHCKELRCLGTDAPSFATIAHLETTMTAHNVFLKDNSRKMLIIEEMKLDGGLSGLSEVRINPWLVEGMHSGPCTVIGIVE